jgi:hypothetical protein
MKSTTIFTILSIYIVPTLALPFNKVRCARHLDCDLITRLIASTKADAKEAADHMDNNPELYHSTADIVDTEGLVIRDKFNRWIPEQSMSS